MEMCQELVILKTVFSPTCTTKHKKCAYFIRCGKKGIYFYYMPTVFDARKKVPKEVAVMLQNKTRGFLHPEQCA